MSTITPTVHPDRQAVVQPVIDAAAERQQRFDAADAERSEKRRQANADFVTVVREAIDGGSNMTELAKAIGMNRQNLHDIVRNASESTT